MPVIDDTWLRTAFQAMQEMLDVDARERNAMIQFLLDEGFWQADKLTTFESAVAKWNACKNPQKSEFFKMGELWALAMRFGRHQLFLRVMEDLGYDTPRLRPTEERRQDLLERIATIAERQAAELQQLHTSLARLAPAVPTTPTVHGQRPSFSLADAGNAQPDNAVARIGCP